MKWFCVVLIGLVFINTTTTSAQHYQHVVFWSRIQLNASLNKQWELATSAHWRRQNDHLLGNNPLASSLMYGGQAQFSRFNQKKTFIFHAAQISCFWPNQLLGKASDYTVPLNREWRYAFGVESIQNLNEKLSLRERVLQEFRFFRSNNNQAVGRIRGRFTARYDFFSSASVFGLTEAVFHDPPQPAALNNFRIHQFWLGGGLTWRLSKYANSANACLMHFKFGLHGD
jgi:hypothetical protein